MHLSDSLPHSRPILRLLGIALTSFFLFLAITGPLFPTPPQLPTFTSPDRIEYSSPHPKDPHPSTYDPTAPKDLILPLPPGNTGLAAESRIAKITILFNGKDPTLVRTIRSHEAHNRKFGYPLFILRRGLLDGGTLDGVWNKPAYILAVLLEEMRKPEGERLEWLFWHDADTILLNPLIPLSLFLPRFPSPPPSIPLPNYGPPPIHLLLTSDPHGLNNGVFLLRIHPWSISLLTAVLSYPIYNPHTPLQYRDQSALAAVLEMREFRQHWEEVPQRWFNAYPAGDGDGEGTYGVRRGDLLVHFAGWGRSERDSGVERWAGRADSKEWEGEWGALGKEVGRWWDAWAVRREGERVEVLQVGREAKEMIERVERWVGEHGGELREEVVREVEKGVGRVREAGGEEGAWVDCEWAREEMQALMAAAEPLRVLVQETGQGPGEEVRTAVMEG